MWVSNTKPKISNEKCHKNHNKNVTYMKFINVNREHTSKSELIFIITGMSGILLSTWDVIHIQLVLLFWRYNMGLIDDINISKVVLDMNF